MNFTYVLCPSAELCQSKRKSMGLHKAGIPGKSLRRRKWSYADGMGMAVNQYWEYNRKYQAPVAVTHGKVAEYPEANQITAPAPAEIDEKITDLEYYESLQ